MKLILASPRGFCAGVDRAIEIVERAIQKYGKPIYVRHEIVHNEYVVQKLKAKGAVFVNEVEEIPTGAVTIFSAHGVSDKVVADAKSRDLSVIDATCPLVTKVHHQAKRAETRGDVIILIGHNGHPEVEGTAGRVKQKVVLVENKEDVAKLEFDAGTSLSYVSQTTLSVDDTKEIVDKLQEKFPHIKGPGVGDICYATQNRQNAVRQLAKETELILVVGSNNSSNSNRLKDLAIESGVKSYLIASATQIKESWFCGVNSVGLTAGASAPEVLIEQVIARLQQFFDIEVKTMQGAIENVNFRLPKELR